MDIEQNQFRAEQAQKTLNFFASLSSGEEETVTLATDLIANIFLLLREDIAQETGGYDEVDETIDKVTDEARSLFEEETTGEIV